MNLGGADALSATDKPLRDSIAELSAQALLNGGPMSDNTSVAALRFLD